MNIYDFDVKDENGAPYSLKKFEGKVLLIVNTATKCGLAGQFEELEEVYKKYHDQGLEILGFPSDQFKQELGSGNEAAEACRLTYGVTFPMHEVIKVNGESAHPLFKYLTEETKGLLGKSVKWNFTKFLVDRDGNVVKRYAPTDKPSKFENDIAKYL
ncbi:glutathione peroxidase [Ureibacillus sinduriensis]|uniref:Glutathione peroxidase n=1 Tax=Ureibacillus sinduriensis BLB-1 = JCM 15800 TaxID=1384057 RepID=A0A0A3HQB9_9BACL|nr:glutathione peroxidase [Ureibacillus sinduriensis]KGR74599.1 glutathione peroxidase [Ureibacillus sinduriensis BLB-1 = JCM 15800]